MLIGISKSQSTFSHSEVRLVPNRWVSKLVHTPTPFSAHGKSACHRFALNVKAQTKSAPSIVAALSVRKADEQATACECLVKTVTTVQFLARHAGLALRVKSKVSGKFCQLMKLRSNDVKFLETSMVITKSRHDLLGE